MVVIGSEETRSPESGKEMVLVSGKEIRLSLPNQIDVTEITIQPVNPPSALEAPFPKGKAVCRARILYHEKTLEHITLVTGKQADLSAWAKIKYWIKKYIPF